MAQRVGVIFGGRSGEHEVSIVSARNVMAALDRDRWEPVPIGIAPDGHWLSPTETHAALAEGRKHFHGLGQPMLGSAGLAALGECDVAFPLVHGTYGEDGTLQGLLEMAALPYAGCGVAASAIGMDKALMKALFREAGIPVGRYGVVRAWEYAEDPAVVPRFVAASGGAYPVFVKPANGGSSVGITKVRSAEDLPAAFVAAFAYDDKVLIEAAIPGREIECSVLGNEHPRASIAGEVVPDREFYDYDSKYAADSGTALLIPAALPGGVGERVQELAVRVYRVMGCEGYARIDFFLTPGGEIVANEVNTIPGFTSISMYPKLWEASGLGYTDLLSEILQLALSRHARRARR